MFEAEKTLNFAPKRPIRSRQRLSILGSKTTSLNTTQKYKRCLEGKNGSTSLQNVTFVAVDVEGSDFINASNLTANRFQI